MQPVINRIHKAFCSTRALTERQREIAHESISKMVAAIIEKQAKKLSRFENN